MKKIIPISKFDIIGRGLVYTISLKENGMGGLRAEWSNLMNQVVEIEGEEYFIKAIEAFALGLDCEHSLIALQVRPVTEQKKPSLENLA